MYKIQSCNTSLTGATRALLTELSAERRYACAGVWRLARAPVLTAFAAVRCVDENICEQVMFYICFLQIILYLLV